MKDIKQKIRELNPATIIPNAKYIFKALNKKIEEVEEFSLEETLTNKIYLGKPVYRKIINKTTSTDSTVYEDLSELNIETMVSITGMDRTDFENIPVPYTYRHASGSINYYIAYSSEDGTSELHVGCLQVNNENESTRLEKDLEIVIEYTKI